MMSHPFARLLCVCRSTGWWTADEGVACRSGKELNKRLSRTAFITLSSYIGNILTPPYAYSLALVCGRPLHARIEIYFRADSLPINAQKRKSGISGAYVCARKKPFSLARVSRRKSTRGGWFNFSDLPGAGDDSGLRGWRLPAIFRIDFPGALVSGVIMCMPLSQCKQFPNGNSPLFIPLLRVITFAL